MVPAERHPINRYFPVAIVALALALIGGRRARKTPQTLTNVGNAIAHHPLISLTVGALVSVTFLSLFVFMAFTLILIPVSILGLLGGVVAIAYGVIVFGYLIGRRIDTQRVGPATAAGTILVMAALVLVGLIPLVGDLFVLGVAFTGLGAVVITYFGLKEFKPVALPE